MYIKCIFIWDLWLWWKQHLHIYISCSLLIALIFKSQWKNFNWTMTAAANMLRSNISAPITHWNCCAHRLCNIIIIIIILLTSAESDWGGQWVLLASNVHRKSINWSTYIFIGNLFIVVCGMPTATKTTMTPPKSHQVIIQSTLPKIRIYISVPDWHYSYQIVGNLPSFICQNLLHRYGS